MTGPLAVGCPLFSPRRPSARLRWFATLLVVSACAGCGGTGVGAPILQQSNLHFDGCPSTPQSTETACRAVATVHNVGASGTSREVFYFSLRGSAGSQQATCTPAVQDFPANGTVDLSCDITVPPLTVPTSLVLSGH